MSNRYYKINPRGFANEYTIYVVDAERAAELEATLPTAERITRIQAIRDGIRRPRSAERNDQQWYGGFACTANSEYQMSRDLTGDAPTDADLIYYAAIATADILNGSD